MAALSPVGVASYNGYTFGTKTETTAFDIRPIQDAAGRTIVYCVVGITLRTIIAAQTTDAIVGDAIERLTKQGGQLTFTGRGFGNLFVNLGRVRDVMWGPVPKVVSLRPLGAGNSCELTWSCEVAIPTCGDAVFQRQIMEFCYRLTFDIDRSGYTRRTYSGHVRVPATRLNVNSRTLPDSADSYREQIVIPPLAGFRRTPGSFTLDESKTRLDFSITDEELPPNTPPVGCIDAKADHALSSTPGKLFEWTGTINGTYEIARGHSVGRARDAFFAFAKNRINATIRELFAGKKKAVIPVQFTMSEPEVYGKTQARFTLVYRVVGASLAEMLAAGSLWRPAPGSDWSKWVQSIAIPLGPRGVAQLTFNVGDDKIIDLCRPTKAGVDSRGGVGNTPTDNELRSMPPDLFPRPTPDTSWLAYRNAVRFDMDAGNVVFHTLPERELRSDPNNKSIPWQPELPNLPPGSGANAGVYPPAERFPPGRGTIENATTGTEVQQRTTPTVYVYMMGYAIRNGGFSIPVPELTDIEGETPIPCSRTDMGEGFVSEVVGNANGPVTSARWNLRYLLKKVPKGPPPVLPNPLHGASLVVPNPSRGG